MLMHLSALRLAVFSALLLAAAPAGAQPDMSAPQALEALKQGKVLVIDLRTPQEWRETGVIPGAGRVDFYRGPWPVLQKILEMTGGDKNVAVALICASGSRSGEAQRFLQKQGFTQVYNVREGMEGSASGPGWLKRRLPVEPCTRC